MEVSQITGAGKDPVARSDADPQLKHIGAIPMVDAIKKDQDQKQSRPEQNEAPSFEHLRQEPLQLLLRAINARLTETFGAGTPPRHPAPAVEQTSAPEVVSARVLLLLNAAFARLKTEHAQTDADTLRVTFQHTAGEILHDSDTETRDVLRNLNLLDAAIAARIDKTVTLIEAALARAG